MVFCCQKLVANEDLVIIASRIRAITPKSWKNRIRLGKKFSSRLPPRERHDGGCSPFFTEKSGEKSRRTNSPHSVPFEPTRVDSSRFFGTLTRDPRKMCRENGAKEWILTLAVINFLRTALSLIWRPEWRPSDGWKIAREKTGFPLRISIHYLKRG